MSLENLILRENHESKSKCNMKIFEKAAKIILQKCLGIRKNENLLLVTDGSCNEFCNIIIHECKNLKIDAAVLEILTDKHYQQEPAGFIGEMMAHADTILMLTQYPLSRTRACQFACSKNSRIISLINTQPEILQRIIETKYSAVESVSQKLADIITIGHNLSIESKAGTTFEMSLSKIKGFSNSGIQTTPGKMSSLPAGEAYFTPTAQSCEGEIVIDGSMEFIGQIEQPIKLKISNGVIKRISGGAEAEQLRKQLKRFGSSAKQIIGFGIGTNDSARLGNSVDEDKIALGSIHISFGNTYFFDKSGRLPNRIDAIVKHPTLTIDGKNILENGQLMLLYH